MVRDNLHWQLVDIPTMHQGYYFVTGTIPQVDPTYFEINPGQVLARKWRQIVHINSLVTGLAITAEKRYWNWEKLGLGGIDGSLKYPGHFGLTMSPSLVLANDATFSFTDSQNFEFGAGTENENAISATYSIATGKEINLLSVLFANRSSSVSFLTQQTIRQLHDDKSTQGRCLRQNGIQYTTSAMVHDFINRASDLGSAHVALARAGISILFEQGDLSADACGNTEVVIPYTKVWKLLSSSGHDLIMGVQ